MLRLLANTQLRGFHHRLIRFPSSTYLNVASSVAENQVMEGKAPAMVKAVRWSEEEKTHLMIVVPALRKHCISWSVITQEFFPHRPLTGVTAHWTGHFQKLYQSGQLPLIEPSPDTARRIEKVLALPAVKNEPKKWTKEEDAQLLSLSSTVVMKGSWKGLEDRLPPNRSHTACVQRYNMLIAKQRLRDLDEKGVTADPSLRSLRVHHSWSEQEDRLLRDLIYSLKNRAHIPWQYILPTFFPNLRSSKLIARYEKKIKPTFDISTHTAHPDNQERIKTFLEELKVKPAKIGRVWSNEADDEKLRQGVAEFGNNYTAIADKYFSTIDEKGKRKYSKTYKQCRHRWAILNPQLSRDTWNEAERIKLRELVIHAYRNFYSDLDVSKIIRHEARWPRDAKVSFASIAREMQAAGYHRETNRCRKEWLNHVDPSLVPPGTPWTPQEKEKIREIMVSGESVSEAWRQIHRSLRSCYDLWRDELSKDYQSGPLSKEEQVKLLLGIAALGQRKYSIVRDAAFPRRLASELKDYWHASQLRIQQIVFNKFNTSSEMRLQCRGYDNSHFLSYLQSLQLTKAAAREVIEEFSLLKDLGKQSSKKR